MSDFRDFVKLRLVLKGRKDIKFLESGQIIISF